MLSVYQIDCMAPALSGAFFIVGVDDDEVGAATAGLPVVVGAVPYDVSLASQQGGVGQAAHGYALSVEDGDVGGQGALLQAVGDVDEVVVAVAVGREERRCGAEIAVGKEYFAALRVGACRGAVGRCRCCRIPV